MNQDAHFEKGGRAGTRMNRTAVLLIAMILLIGTAVGTTVAYLTTKTEPIENTFEYAEVSCEVSQKYENKTAKDVQVKNTGTTDVYIRATYIVNWLDAHGNIVASDPAGYSYNLIAATDGQWTQGTDGFFYYTSSVAPGASTEGSLLTCTATYPSNPEYTLSVEILAEAIQSTPEEAVQEAWSVTVSDGKLNVQ